MNERINTIWTNIKQRCYNPKNPSFKDYGGRGIRMFYGWKRNYKLFEEWAINNGYKDNLQIDRKKVNLGYYPSNCRWVGYEEQANNKRNIDKYLVNGEWLSLAQICRKLNLDKRKIWHRVFRQKMSLKDALFLGNKLKKRAKNPSSLMSLCAANKVSYSSVRGAKRKWGMSNEEAIKHFCRKKL